MTKFYYHEVVFEDDTQICIKSTKDDVSFEDLSAFLEEECAKFGKIIETSPIDENIARCCYDFSNEPHLNILI